MTNETLRLLDQPVPPACKCDHCEQPAVIVRQWRTPRMKAPAFWYYCDNHIHKLDKRCACGILLINQYDLITGECPACFNAERSRS